MPFNRVLLVVVLCAVHAPSSNGAITNIDISGSLGPVEASSSFIPTADSSAHFSLATLTINESVLGNRGAWDLQIDVTRTPPEAGLRDEVISIDKNVSNLTDLRWEAFHMTLGFGMGSEFVESGEAEFLFFNDSPPPAEETSAFQNPPVKDEDVRADTLWWFGPPGLEAEGTARFWLAMTVPDELFDDNNTATFTLREQAMIVPEASSVIVWTLLLACIIRSRFIHSFIK
jgi:hypothetical protein